MARVEGRRLPRSLVILRDDASESDREAFAQGHTKRSEDSRNLRGASSSGMQLIYPPTMHIHGT